MRRALLAVLVLAACSNDAPVDKAAATKATATKAHEKAHATVAPPRVRPTQLTQVTIKALGMYCEESCPLKVRTALADLPAVYELGFDVSNESIFVSYDASLGTPKDVTKPMLVAIKSAGFDPWLAKETWPDGASVQVVQN
ncbi:MAG: heavy-metal-associated domain-containing protein [Deltaproteobacteria bacterium]|nr:heavy-metal-associated domain-containing protein [Deltaproteobacteria bacterium]